MNIFKVIALKEDSSLEPDIFVVEAQNATEAELSINNFDTFVAAFIEEVIY